jgi:hypothetical protein
MRTFFPSLALAFLAVLPVASAATLDRLPVKLNEAKLHDFDHLIPASMGYDGGSVIYLSELGSITDSELKVREQYEPIGCFPFYFMKDGKAVETGYNCRSFFCTGYQKGPKQCRDRSNKIVGGIVEINRRLASFANTKENVYFTDFPAHIRTPEMQRVIDDLAAIRCRPFYILHFDVAVGQGYQCDAVGKYPNYSADAMCAEDWRDGGGMQCTTAQREDEKERRMQILGVVALPSSAASASSVSSESSSSVSSVVVEPPKQTATATVHFDDVIEGKYGFTAITTLASEGVINGYPDGTFRPMVTVSRGEFAKLLLQALHHQELLDERDCFHDVRDQWFSAPVCAAKRLGWVRGYGDGMFRPHRGMTMAEALTLLAATLPNIDTQKVQLPQGVDANAWYAPAVKKAIALGILREPIFRPDRVMTRADAAVWMYRAGHTVPAAVSQL